MNRVIQFRASSHSPLLIRLAMKRKLSIFLSMHSSLVTPDGFAKSNNRENIIANA